MYTKFWYDRIDRDLLFDKLTTLGMDHSSLSVIKRPFNSSSLSVAVEGQCSEIRASSAGLLQGLGVCSAKREPACSFRVRRRTLCK